MLVQWKEPGPLFRGFGDRPLLSHPLVKSFLSGVERQCPVMRISSTQWALPQVLNALVLYLDAFTSFPHAEPRERRLHLLCTCAFALISCLFASGMVFLWVHYHGSDTGCISLYFVSVLLKSGRCVVAVLPGRPGLMWLADFFFATGCTFTGHQPLFL